ncbi:TatD family hydrolase [Halomonas sp. TD01]|uniref:TatD family hydrolase n=1 Tax=Halomonas sp. TD01 TaxID=999141 RepID=UPI000214E36C|nr:TatD family hydrolase [Halomonas sp. TD01]EGP18498.1 TatD-related deoxyribonuclease [Halomonas sp. TD01]CAH1044605.1 Putative deoxyribonuclease YjjV [Halomonas sp. TD01]
MLIDAHCHLDFAAFDDDRDAVIENAKAVGVEHFVVPSTTRYRWPNVLALGVRSEISLCVGLHPYFIDEHSDQDLVALEQLLAEQEAQAGKRFVAVGECGIDGRFTETLDKQWAYFDAQLRLAKQFGLPVVVHCVKANDLVSKRLRQLALPSGGLIHGFSGSYEQAARFLDLGYTLGLGGAITYERALRLREVVSRLPDDGFVLETDSPDMPLSGYQGQRNEPSRLEKVARVVAELRRQPFEKIAAQSSANAIRLFQLPHLNSH